MTLRLQRCTDCGAVQYPSRDACRSCLADALVWNTMAVVGSVCSEATIHRSIDPTPLPVDGVRIGVVSALGLRFIALLAPDAATGMHVALTASPTRPGAILAVPSAGQLQG